MARALRLTVIAEGVETQGHFDFLRADGCDEIQGYLPQPGTAPTLTIRIRIRQKHDPCGARDR